jgi:hypothetical protein
MQISGEHRFAGPRQLLYQMLLDPEVLAATLPGVQHFEEVEPDTYESSMRVGIASVRGTYQGRVEVSERVPDESFRLRIEGSGRPGGGTADARVRLEDDGSLTVMHYQAEVRARGTIARLGNRLMGGAARLLVGQFCKAIEQRIERSAA